MLKKYLFPLMLAGGTAATALYSCNKVEDLIKIQTPITLTTSLDLPPIPVTGTFTFPSEEMEADIDAAIRSANSQLSVDNIKSARIEYFRITLQPDDLHPNDNLTALSDVKVDLSSNTQPSWITIASQEGPLPEPYEVDLPVNGDQELKDYLRGSIFRYQITATANRPTFSTQKAVLEVRFRVEAGLD